VRFTMSFCDKVDSIFREAPAATGPFSRTSDKGNEVDAKASARKESRSTFTRGSLTALVMIVSSATSWVVFVFVSIKILPYRCDPGLFPKRNCKFRASRTAAKHPVTGNIILRRGPCFNRNGQDKIEKPKSPRREAYASLRGPSCPQVHTVPVRQSCKKRSTASA